MNDELQKQLADMLASIIDTASSAKNFLEEQLPDVV